MFYQKYDLELKKYDEDGFFSGYASIFGNVDAHHDIVMPGAFTKSLERTQPKMLWQHNPEKPIGVWKKVAEDDKGLWVEGQLLLDLRQGREAYILLKKGIVDALSIGFYIKEATRDQEKRYLHHLDLHEVSLVTFAANQGARITYMKTVSLTTRMRTLIRMIENS